MQYPENFVQLDVRDEKRKAVEASSHMSGLNDSIKVEWGEKR